MKKTCASLFVGFFSLFCLLSCGLEAFYYIDYIQNSIMDTTVRATINLPSSNDEGYSSYFDHFIIFYRIYISDIDEIGLIASTSTKDIFNRSLNSSLSSDFDVLYSSTDKASTTVNTANLENTFLNRKYFQLEMENANISSILGSGSLGRTLEIAFPPNTGVRPTLILNGNSYILQRVKGDDVLGIPPFYQKPDDRYFLNYPELYDTANATSTINNDVATNTKAGADFRYTYVSMYIAAVGKSYELPPRNIYSQPTFIGVFKLAESS
jgi:hypothetical protein